MNVNQPMYKEKLWKLFRKAEETIAKATLKIFKKVWLIRTEI